MIALWVIVAIILDATFGISRWTENWLLDGLVQRFTTSRRILPVWQISLKAEILEAKISAFPIFYSPACILFICKK